MLVNVLTTWMMMMELFNLQNMEDLLGFLGWNLAGFREKKRVFEGDRKLGERELTGNGSLKSWNVKE